jgi:hypothetical protein
MALVLAILASTIKADFYIGTPPRRQVLVQKYPLYQVVHPVSKDTVSHPGNDGIGGKPEGVFGGGFRAFAAGRQIKHLHLIARPPRRCR